MSGLFLSIKQVQQLADLAESTAQRRLSVVRKAYNIPKYEQVNVFEYCKYYRLDVDLVLQLLNEKSK